MILQTKIEITAPAGSFESLMAAIHAGADSIYFGVGKLNMRAASASNFDFDDLRAIVDTCKQYNKKAYLTINTVVYDGERTMLKELLQAAKDADVDAVIASDFSVLQMAKEAGLTIHCSTQCNISNIDAVKFFANFADVMVLARELTMQQVYEIAQAIQHENIVGPAGELVKLEIFVHGALCMAVSGKCYLSLDNLNYSANRGQCLQQCRRAYKVTDIESGTELQVENEYIMSPKDLCTIDFLDKVLQSGVSILKIEGRGRAPEYVKTTVSCYKEAVESVLADSYTPEKIQQWKQRLETIYNRGFWDGYYLGRKTGEWSDVHGSRATHKKLYVAKCTNYFSQLQVAELLIESGELCVGDHLSVNGPTTGVIEFTVEEIRVDLKPVQKAVKGDLCSVQVPALIRRADKVYQIVPTEFYE